VKLPSFVAPEELLRFRMAFPAIPVVVVSASEEKERIRACLDAGARGYVPKTSALLGLAGAMQTVVAGGRHVPPEAQRPDLKPAASGG